VALPRFRKKISFRVPGVNNIIEKIPVSTFKDAVYLSPNDDYYLVTDSEDNIGNMHFLYPIPEPQVTKPELLQENKNDIVGNKTLHSCVNILHLSLEPPHVNNSRLQCTL
jgi:hypothetical protein